MIFELKNGIAYYEGKNITTLPHTHHALELIFGIGATFDFQVGNQYFHNIDSILVYPDVQHQFLGEDQTYLFIFLEPELLQSQQIIKQTNLSTLKALSLPISITAPVLGSRILDFSFFNTLPGLCISDERVLVSEPRIKACLEFIKMNIWDGELRLKNIANQVFLSESRLAHLFKQEIGLPVRRYILWCRMQAALMRLRQGQNLSQSSYAAGFSDTGHFSRSFATMFGVTPSSVFKSSKVSQFIQV